MHHLTTTTLLLTLLTFFPLLPVLAQMYGSPGIISMSAFNPKDPANGTCTNVNLKGNYAIHLPAEWNPKGAHDNCGKTMTVYFYPRYDGGLHDNPELVVEEGVVADTCTGCESWEVQVDEKLYGKVYPEGKGTVATWGPAMVFGP